MDEKLPKCDLCDAEADYEVLDRIGDSDIYQVEQRLCAKCAGVGEVNEDA